MNAEAVFLIGVLVIGFGAMYVQCMIWITDEVVEKLDKFGIKLKILRLVLWILSPLWMMVFIFCEEVLGFIRWWYESQFRNAVRKVRGV